MANPWERYTNSIKFKTYPGSSRYWGDLGSRQAPNTFRERLGYPGSVTRYQLAQEAGVQPSPQDVIARPAAEGRYQVRDGQYVNTGNTVNPPRNTADLFENVSVVRNPGMDEATNALLADYRAASTTQGQSFKEMMDYYKNQIAPKITSAFETTTTAIDPSKIGATMRGIDTRQEADLRSLLDQYRLSNAAAIDAQNALAGERRSNMDRWEQYIRDSEALARGAANRATTRYALSRGGTTGVNSAMPTVGAKVFLDRLLPEYQRATAARDSVLAAETALRASQAGMEAGRYGFAAPTINTIFGNQRSTEQYVNGLASQLSALTTSQAEQVLRSMSLPDEIVSQVMQRRIANLGGIGSIIPFGRYEGLSYKPGMELTPQQWYSTPVTLNTSNPTAGYPTMDELVGILGGGASRYAPMTAPMTGTATAPMTAPTAPTRATMPGIPYVPIPNRYGPLPTRAPAGPDGFFVNSRGVTPTGRYRGLPAQLYPPDYRAAIEQAYQ